jgi:pteridine reductase
LIQTNKQDTKIALVTGGARRIGAAIVTALHDAGFSVIIHCHHSLTEAQALAKTLNQVRANSATVLQKDLITAHAAEDIIQEALSLTNRLDVLVNNASVFLRTDPDAFNQDEWDILFNTHVKAPFLLSMHARHALLKQQGCIINITDIHAQNPLMHYSAYCQSKAALNLQTQSLAREFAPDIRVNAVAPGAILWPEHNNSLTPEIKNNIIKQTPLKRHGNPEMVAQAVLALIHNSFITGQILRVDGGRSLVT